MNMQELYSIASQVSFAGACVLFVVTARYAVVHDVRGVMDDLSGRRRQRGIEDTYERVRTATSYGARELVDDSSADAGLMVEASPEIREETLTSQEETLVGQEETPAGQEETLADVPAIDRASRDLVASPTRTAHFEITREIVLCGLDAKTNEGGVML